VSRLDLRRIIQMLEQEVAKADWLGRTVAPTPAAGLPPSPSPKRLIDY